MIPPRVLTVRLPYKKVFPTGPIYLMSLVNRSAPGASQRFLDLAIVERRRRESLLLETLREFKPDVVAFSWRDIQIFSPQDLDPAMRDAFIFFHHPSLVKKARSAFSGLRHMLTYGSAISHNLSLIRSVEKASGSAAVALGGSSVRIFHEWLKPKIPARVRVFPERDLEAFSKLLGLPLPANPIEPEIDLEAMEEAFPQWKEYRGEVIGIQTKQGCPLSCLYCLYGFLEGKTVRRRDPSCVVAEFEAYARRWGSRRFWIADAQLLSEPADRGHLARILEGLIRAKLDIQWSGYLRIHDIDPELASLMVRSGLQDLEVSLNSGAQEVLDRLRLGFSIEGVMKGFEVFKSAGYSGRIFLNLSLNAPGETRDTLRLTLGTVRRIRKMFGDDRVVPVVFFLAIQPHTGLERLALEEGRIASGYNSLSVRPRDILKLIYNPPPLGRLIGRSCAKAFSLGGEASGRILGFLEEELNDGGDRVMISPRK
jgi:hypothetical protein